MNDFFIYAFVAENLGDVVGLVALDGFDAFAVVVDDTLGNDEPSYMTLTISPS